MCMYVRMDYPCTVCIYVFIFTIFAPWSVMCRSLVEKKNYGCHWNFLFFLLFDSIMLSFAALKISPLHKV